MAQAGGLGSAYDLFCYAEDDAFDGAHWWRHTQDGLDVVRETLGLLNAWTGFPLRPAQN